MTEPTANRPAADDSEDADGPADTKVPPNIAQVMEDVRSQLPPERVRVRRQATEDARRLIESHLEGMSEEDVRALLALFNKDWVSGTERANRFSPAFVGVSANRIAGNAPVVAKWVKRLWAAQTDEEVARVLDEFWASDEVPGAGRSFPTTVLHVRSPDRFAPWTNSLEHYQATLTGRKPRVGRRGDSYLAYARECAEVRKANEISEYGVDLMLYVAGQPADPVGPKGWGAFPGFTLAAFEFLRDLVANNSEEWFQPRKAQFHELIRDPLRALVEDLGASFASKIPTSIEARPKSPETLANIRKNVWGKVQNPYWPHFWAALHRPDHNKTEDFQLAISLRPRSFEFGLSTGSASPEELRRLSDRLRSSPYAARVTEAALNVAKVWTDRVDDDEKQTLEVRTSTELADAIVARPIAVTVRMSPSMAAEAGRELGAQVSDAFLGLYPLWVLATESMPEETLEDWFEPTGPRGMSRKEFLSATLLDQAWLTDVNDLLRDKSQLVVYGPPGTGKTYVAELLARYLTGSDARVTTVQFHPSYGYEDFVEGIRPSVDGESGRLSYAVRPGILRTLAEKARRDPSHRYVLLIDEINRGNLPRIFGELLYLVERRGVSVQLPVSGDSFSIPENLVFLGTMNTADQSIALLDVALRRRFHFVRLEPDAEVLRVWLERHAPDMVAAADVLRRLNEALGAKGVSPNLHIGHSHFMRPQLDVLGFERIWNGSVIPTLEEYFYSKPEEVDEFAFETFADPHLRDARARISERMGDVSPGHD